MSRKLICPLLIKNPLPGPMNLICGPGQNVSNLSQIFLEQEIKVSIKNSALVLVDCENDFLSEGGKLYEAVKPSLEAQNVPAKLNQALDKAHQIGMPVIFTVMAFDEGYPEMGDNPYGILSAIRESGAFIRHQWGAKIADNLHVDAKDIILEKSQMCAFKKTGLLETLTSQNITSLYFAGLVTDLCLETSLRSAYDQGFDSYALTDCMAALDQSLHNSTVENNFPLFSKPIQLQDFLQKLGS